MPSDFNLQEYLESLDNFDFDSPDGDLVYLSGISEKELRQLFSLDTFVKLGDQRSRDYEKSYKYIYSGCSETTGEYLTRGSTEGIYSYNEVEPFIWGSIVGRALDNPESINLSVGGASAMGIVNMIIRQIRTYGSPEHIFVLFPNLDSRITFVRDETKLVSKWHDDSLILDITGVGDQTVTYSKKPHIMEDILTKRWITYLNIQSILALEEVCRAHGINLIYSTWSKSAHKVLTIANRLAAASNHAAPFPNYIVSNYRKSPGGCVDAAKTVPKNCHLEVSDHPRWDIGVGNGHMGVHAHIHMAEIYTNELSNRGFSLNL